MKGIYIATEDSLSEAVASRLIKESNLKFESVVCMGRAGNGYLKKRLSSFIKLANSCPILILTDLDRVNCPPELIQQWFGARVAPCKMLFRVVVREIESWLMADREAFAKFSGVSINRLPMNPECIQDPKQTLLNLVRKYGAKNIKGEILPTSGSRSTIGIGYNSTLVDFVQNYWNPKTASSNAESLSRTLERLLDI